jgi:hypothetical protein
MLAIQRNSTSKPKRRRVEPDSSASSCDRCLRQPVRAGDNPSRPPLGGTRTNDRRARAVSRPGLVVRRWSGRDGRCSDPAQPRGEPGKCRVLGLDDQDRWPRSRESRENPPESGTPGRPRLAAVTGVARTGMRSATVRVPGRPRSLARRGIRQSDVRRRSGRNDLLAGSALAFLLLLVVSRANTRAPAATNSNLGAIRTTTKMIVPATSVGLIVSFWYPPLPVARMGKSSVGSRSEPLTMSACLASVTSGTGSAPPPAVEGWRRGRSVRCCSMPRRRELIQCSRSVEKATLGRSRPSIATLERHGATLEAVEQHGAVRVRRYALRS